MRSNPFPAPPPVPPRLRLDEPGPFWSVMIPTYNPKRELLEIALDSVLRQAPAVERMEIVVMDDCSPQGSPEEWVRQFAGDRVRFIRQPANLGLAGIWNECIAEARGKWVHIFHQDDVLMEGYYQNLLEGMESSPEAGAAFCRFNYVGAGGELQETAPALRDSPGPLPDFPSTLVTGGPHIICASIVVRRAVYEELGGFRQDLTHALDWEMWVRIANRHPVHYEPRVMASWRRHPGGTTAAQITTGENVRDIGKTIRVWRWHFPDKIGKSLSARASSYWADQGLSLAESHLQMGNYQVFRAQLSAALSCSKSPPVIHRAAGLVVRAGCGVVRRTAARFAKSIGEA